MAIAWTYLSINGERPLNRTVRDIKAQLSFIEVGGDIVRLASGQRRSLRRRQFDKYRVSLSGTAVRKPAIDHLLKGDVVNLEWPGHIDLPGDIPQGNLPRPAVPGSVMRFGEVNGVPVRMAAGDPRILVTAFRPILNVMIDNIDVTEDAIGASVSWSITGEEE